MVAEKYYQKSDQREFFLSVSQSQQELFSNPSYMTIFLLLSTVTFTNISYNMENLSNIYVRKNT